MVDTIKYLLYMMSKITAYQLLIDDIESHILFNKGSRKKYSDTLFKLKKRHNKLYDFYKDELFLYRLSKIKVNDFTKDVGNIDIEDYFRQHILDMNTNVLYNELFAIYIKGEEL